jgi:hypothetical protein
VEYAICARYEYGFIFEIEEHFEGNSKDPPAACPECDGRIWPCCPNCFHAILELPGPQHPRCPHCNLLLFFATEYKFRPRIIETETKRNQNANNKPGPTMAASEDRGVSARHS